MIFTPKGKNHCLSPSLYIYNMYLWSSKSHTALSQKHTVDNIYCVTLITKAGTYYFALASTTRLCLIVHVSLFCRSTTADFFLNDGYQARNQLGTPGRAKSFLRGAQIFWTMSNSFKRFPTHFSRGGEKKFYLRPPWLRAWWLHMSFQSVWKLLSLRCGSRPENR